MCVARVNARAGDTETGAGFLHILRHQTINPVYHIPRHQSPMSLDTIKVETIGLGRGETLSVEAKAAFACSVLATHPSS